MSIKVLVALALPQLQEVVEVELPRGARVADAIEAARLRERFPGLEPARMAVGIWSRPCGLDAPLRDGDRVELYRPLSADPKSMRRARARVRPSTRSRSGP